MLSLTNPPFKTNPLNIRPYWLIIKPTIKPAANWQESHNLSTKFRQIHFSVLGDETFGSTSSAHYVSSQRRSEMFKSDSFGRKKNPKISWRD